MEAKRALSKKLFEKQVKLKITGKDKYNRLLAHLYLDDRWINKEMVSDGWAWHFKKYSSDKQLADAEIEARNAPRGLWVDEQPVSPWDFRDSIASSPTPSPEPKRTFVSPSPSNTPPSRIATAMSQPQPQRSGETVYITKTGSKYHSSGCRFLSKSKIPISLEEAKARYSPCSVCGS